jgi:hypothetical protein
MIGLAYGAAREEYISGRGSGSGLQVYIAIEGKGYTCGTEVISGDDRQGEKCLQR